MSVVHLVVVDPQNDFVVADDGHGNRGRLVVPGAEGDISRLSAMIRRVGRKLDDIHVTLDSHQTVGIERPRWWRRVSDGAEPAPFTCLGIHPDGRRVVKYDFGASGPVPTEEEYTTYIPSMMHQGGVTGKGSFGYLQALAAKGRYPHIVWTEHCIVGQWGWSIVPELAQTLSDWERDEFARVNYVVKGNNPNTEHFSGVQAEVPDPSDPATQINTHLIRSLEDADIVAIAGEALSHCVSSTGRDIAAAFSNPEYIRKLVLLTDATSNVTGFDAQGNAFIQDLVSKGMKLSTTTDFLT